MASPPRSLACIPTNNTPHTFKSLPLRRTRSLGPRWRSWKRWRPWRLKRHRRYTTVSITRCVSDRRLRRELYILCIIFVFFFLCTSDRRLRCELWNNIQTHTHTHTHVYIYLSSRVYISLSSLIGYGRGSLGNEGVLMRVC